MKSTEVYRLIREVVGPWCKANGFKRTPSGVLGYVRPYADEYQIFWFYCSSDGWDRFRGSKFTVEFQLSPTPELYGGIPPIVGGVREIRRVLRRRFTYFLDEGEREQVRIIQNRIISRLTPPPADYPLLLALNERDRDWYLGHFFQPVDQPYSPREDIWLRYHEEEDVREWARFILQRLPRMLEQNHWTG